MKKWCMLIAGLLIVIVAVYLVGDFYSTSDQLYHDYVNVDGGSNYSREDFYTEYLDVVVENQGSTGDSSLANSVLSGSGFLLGTMDNWYIDIPENTKKGNKTSEICIKSTNTSKIDKYPDIYIYDGLPWEPDSKTFFFDIRKAREDVWEIYDKAGISHKSGSQMALSSGVGVGAEISYEKQYAADIDGVAAVGIGVFPAMWQNYYTSYAMVPISMDTYTGNWNYKIVIVVVDKGDDINNQQKWKYIPATRVSYKAHAFYGGVIQTNVKLDPSSKEIQIATTNSGQNGGYTIYKNISEVGKDENSIVGALREIESTPNKADTQGAWWDNYVEMFNVGSTNAAYVTDNYDFVGYIIYGETFLNMNSEGCYEK